MRLSCLPISMIGCLARVWLAGCKPGPVQASHWKQLRSKQPVNIGPTRRETQAPAREHLNIRAGRPLASLARDDDVVSGIAICVSLSCFMRSILSCQLLAAAFQTNERVELLSCLVVRGCKPAALILEVRFQRVAFGWRIGRARARERQS